jgi:hypothetical protein
MKKMGLSLSGIKFSVYPDINHRRHQMLEVV